MSPKKLVRWLKWKDMNERRVGEKNRMLIEPFQKNIVEEKKFFLWTECSAREKFPNFTSQSLV
jgi:hypothetical protein